MENVATIALVLKTGGDTYNYKYVNNLVNGIKEHTTIPTRIVCLTDDSTGFDSRIDEVVEFKHNWPKWWGKIELFRPGVFPEGQNVFYIDLDTFIVGNVDDILKCRSNFCGLRDFYNLSAFASGLLSFKPEYVKKIYTQFITNPNHYMAAHKIGGDQAFIREINLSHQYFQDLYLHWIKSYKADCLKGSIAKLPYDTRIVCCHGQPRPHEIDTEFAKYWTQ